MNFSIVWDPKAVKQLEKLPGEASGRIVAKLKESGDTGRFLEVLTEHKYGHKIRVGDYRVLVDISYDTQEIIVRYVGHRKSIYKRT